MKKLLFLSPDCFFDSDFPILKLLVNHFDLVWFPIISQNDLRYNKEDIETFSNQYHIQTRIWKRNWRRRSLKQILFNYKLIRSIKNEKASIVYLEYTGDLFFTFLAILFLKRKNTIIAIHDVMFHSTNVSSLKSRIESFLNRLVQCYFKNFHLFSKTQKDIFDSITSNKNSFYAPLALKDFGESTIARLPKENCCNFLFFGLIEYYKGLDLLIQAIEQLSNQNIGKFKLTIAGKGEGQYWNDCKELIKTKENYDLQIGYIPDELIPNLFVQSHFIVLPYRDVTQSGPLMIAMNYHLPVLAADFDGFTENIVNEKNGFIFKNENPDSLVEQLSKCIQLPNSDYETMISTIKTYTQERFSIESITEKYLNFFNKI